MKLSAHRLLFVSFIIIALSIFFKVLFGQVHQPYQYYHPKSGSQHISIYNNIAIRFGEDISNISKSELEERIVVTGSKSGRIDVRGSISTDSKTILFNPVNRYEIDEVVDVNFLGMIETDEGNLIPPIRFRFRTSKKDLIFYQDNFATSIEKEFKDLETNESTVLDTIQIYGPNILPSLFPIPSINNQELDQKGYLFTAPFYLRNGEDLFTYLMISDNYGTPIFYKRIEGFGMDLKKHKNGLITYFESKKRKFYALNDRYEFVDSFQCGNGYPTDLHEIRILDNGHVLLMSYDTQPIAMDSVVNFGNPDALVTGLVIQELDLKRNVIFQWRSWDDFEITDCTHINMTNPEVDYVHGNAIDVDHDGNLLISSRSLDEITKIDRTSGKVLWRMGGKKNQFTFINDDRGFSRQHHIRVQENGNYTLFDNGKYLDPKYSSALEYKIDEENMTAELVWSYSDFDTYGAFMGNAQRLENNHTVIGWGGTYPSVTEINEDGDKVLEISYPLYFWSYRAFRFDWDQNLFEIEKDTLNFYSADERKDTLGVKVWNNSDEDIILTSAVTRSDLFAVINKWPLTIRANQYRTINISAEAAPESRVYDVLTLRADKETEGVGVQINLVQHGTTDLLSEEMPVPKEINLSQNYPNPFNPETVINYKIPNPTDVKLTIYDLAGKEVLTLVDEYQNSQSNSVSWKGNNNNGKLVASGIYFYVLETDKKTITKKMLLLK